MNNRPNNTADVRLYRLVMWLSIVLAFVAACNLFCNVSTWTHSLQNAAAIRTTQGVVNLHTAQISELRDQVQGVEFISTDAEPEEPPLTSSEIEHLESEGYGAGFIDRIKTNSKERREHRKFHPIRDLKDTSANGVTMTRNVAIGVGLGCIGVPLFLIALAVLAGRGRR